MGIWTEWKILNQQLLKCHVFDILKKQQLVHFPYESVSSHKQAMYVEAKLGFKRPIPFHGDFQTFDSMCYCGMPSSYYNTVTCSLCKNEYHQCCSLITEKFAKEIEPYFCFHCNFNLGEANEASEQDINSLVNSIITHKDDASRLIKFSKVTRNIRDLIYRRDQFDTINQALKHYDIAMFISRRGKIYQVLPNLPESFNASDLTFCLIKLIGRFTKRNMFPLYTNSDHIINIENDDHVKLVLKKHTPILHKTLGGLKKLLIEMNNLPLEGKTFHNCQSIFRDYQNKINLAKSNMDEFENINFNSLAISFNIKQKYYSLKSYMKELYLVFRDCEKKLKEIIYEIKK